MKEKMMQTLVVYGDVRALWQHSGAPLRAPVERVAKQVFHAEDLVHVGALRSDGHAVAVEVVDRGGVIVLKTSKRKLAHKFTTQER